MLVGLAIPVTALKTAMPSIKVVPAADSSRIGYEQVQAAFGPGATGPLQIVAPGGRGRRRPRDRAAAIRGIARCVPHADRAAAMALVTAIPTAGPLEPRRSGPRSTGCAQRCRPARSSVAPVAENHDLQAALSAKTPLVIGVVLGLGFLLLLVALQAPLIAAAGVLTNLLATGAAFGVREVDLPGRRAVTRCSASSRRASSTRGGRCSSSR